MGPNISYRNVHTGPRQEQEPDQLSPIVPLGPLPVPVPVLLPCSVNKSLENLWLLVQLMSFCVQSNCRQSYSCVIILNDKKLFCKRYFTNACDHFVSKIHFKLQHLVYFSLNKCHCQIVRN